MSPSRSGEDAGEAPGEDATRAEETMKMPAAAAPRAGMGAADPFGSKYFHFAFTLDVFPKSS